MMVARCIHSKVCLKSWKHLAFPYRNRNWCLRSGDASQSTRIHIPSSLRGCVAAKGRMQTSLPGFYSPTDLEIFIMVCVFIVIYLWKINKFMQSIPLLLLILFQIFKGRIVQVYSGVSDLFNRLAGDYPSDGGTYGYKFSHSNLIF